MNTKSINNNTNLNSAKVVALVQARMSSSRLPGKVMRTLARRPMIWHIVERLKKVSGLNNIVVATTTHQDDIPLIKYLKNKKIDTVAYDGDNNDVLGRFIYAAQNFSAKYIVRICGDCPLIHPPTISRMITHLLSNNKIEYVGVENPILEGGIEAFPFATLLKLDHLTTKPHQREHVVPYIFENQEQFVISSIKAEPKFSHLKFRYMVDTWADLKFMRTIYNKMYQRKNIIDLHKVLDFLYCHNSLLKINQHVNQKSFKNFDERHLFIFHQLSCVEKKALSKMVNHLIEKESLGIKIIDLEQPGFDLLNSKSKSCNYHRLNQFDQYISQYCCDFHVATISIFSQHQSQFDHLSWPQGIKINQVAEKTSNLTIDLFQQLLKNQ